MRMKHKEFAEVINIFNNLIISLRNRKVESEELNQIENIINLYRIKFIIDNKPIKNEILNKLEKSRMK